MSVSPINLEVSVSSQARPSEIMGSNNDQQMKLNDGRWTFPDVIPTTSVRAVDPDKLKAWVDTPVLTSMPQPITTKYASLTSDKLSSSQTLVSASKSSLHSAAALKSVQILSKFWGDEVEEGEDHISEAPVSSNKIVDPQVIQKWANTLVLTPMVIPVTVMEETLSHDNRPDMEEDNVETIVSDFEQHYPSLSESTKEEKKTKKHVNKVKPANFNSAGVRTRAEKCTSKVALAATK